METDTDVLRTRRSACFLKNNVADELRRYIDMGIRFLVEMSGFEPPTSRVQGGRSPS